MQRSSQRCGGAEAVQKVKGSIDGGAEVQRCKGAECRDGGAEEVLSAVVGAEVQQTKFAGAEMQLQRCIGAEAMQWWCRGC